jgi:hypothetical protein
MTDIKDLPDNVRKFIRRIIRAHCRKNQIYQKAHEHGVGIEQTEETVEKLLDDKKLFIETNDDSENPKFWIKPR